MYSPLLQKLIQDLRCLPGVGAKTAQRMAFHLLERARAGGLVLADSLKQAMQELGHCQKCRIFTEAEFCPTCSSAKRNHKQLCVVEQPSDVVAIEQAGHYQGIYYVLLGQLSPLDGIGPQELGLDTFTQKLHDLDEVILATSATVEGEATAHYIVELCESQDVLVTRIAHGVPLGGELDYVDGGTLSHAFAGRKPYQA